MKNRLHSEFSRRRFLSVSAGTLAAATILGRGAAAASPGSNPGKYKIDLGGYNGPELTDQKITLRFMRQDYPTEVNETFNKAYAAFMEAYPNITVEEERVPYGDLPQKVQVYVSSGDAPDIMMGRNDFASAYSAGELALPLNDFFSEDYIIDIYKPLRDSATIGGSLLCVPWETNPTLIYFNREIFKRAGVDTPPEVTDIHEGWNVEQYINALRAVTDALRSQGDESTFGLQASMHGGGGPGSNYTQLECIWVRMMGDPNADPESSIYRTFAAVSADGLKASGYLDTPEAAAGMTNYQTLFTEGLTPKGIVPDMYTGGVAATGFGSLNWANRFRANGAPFDWGVTPAPRGRIVYNTTVADSPFVWSGTPHANEAAALLAFIVGDTNRLAFHKAWGSMPSRASLVALDSRYQTDQVNQLVVSVADGAYGPPKTPGWFDYFNAVNPAVKDIALGADPAERLSAAAKQIDGLLAKYR